MEKATYKIWLIILPILFLFGCATFSPRTDLEDRVAKLEDEILMLQASGVGATQKHYGRTCIQTGDCAAGSSLEELVNMSDGDTAVIPYDNSSGTSYGGPLHYLYVDPSSTGESHPDIVVPNTGTGEWFLQELPIQAGGTGAFTATAARTNLEITEDVKCIMWEDPVDTDDFQSIFTALEHNVTVTRVQCESDGTVVLDLQNDDGTPADIVDASTDLSCDSDGDDACGSGCGQTVDGDATVDQGDAIDVKVVSVAGGATRISICFTLQRP